jgi:hypothetical protein
MGKLPFLCLVTPASLYSAFTATNTSSVAGQTMDLRLIGKDRYGNLVNSRTNVILVELLSTDNVTLGADLSTNATHFGGGFSRAAFRVTKSGLYSVHVTIDSYPAQKNPFWVICIPEAKSSAASSGLQILSITNVTELAGQDSTGGTTGVWVCLNSTCRWAIFSVLNHRLAGLVFHLCS